ncbi:MAG: hypothetical protein PWP55_463 [Clostridiales bacterium]|nr:hypothetical protein [Clostridiales bacterium]
MDSRKFIIRAAVLIVLLAFVLMIPYGTYSLAAGSRLYGSAREYTAAAISKDGWPDGSDDAVLVNGYTFADALAAGPLAKLLDAPILLTRKDVLPRVTKDEMDRLGVKVVYIIGGTGVVSYDVERAIDKSSERVAGRDRYQTAVAVAQKMRALGASADEVILARSDDYADALAAAAVPQAVPILFAGPKNAKSLHPITASALGALGAESIIVAGGTTAVSDEAAAGARKIIGMPHVPIRLSGKTRYETALAVADYFKPRGGYKGAVLATGSDFADALVSGPYAAKKGYALIMVNNKSANDPLSDTARSFIKANTDIETDDVIVLGGSKVVPDKAVSDAVEAAAANELNVIDVY